MGCIGSANGVVNPLHPPRRVAIRHKACCAKVGQLRKSLWELGISFSISSQPLSLIKDAHPQVLSPGKKPSTDLADLILIIDIPFEMFPPYLPLYLNRSPFFNPLLLPAERGGRIVFCYGDWFCGGDGLCGKLSE